MKNFKKRFMDDPQFALTVMIIGGTVAAGLLTATSKMLTAGTYTYRASKM